MRRKFNKYVFSNLIQNMPLNFIPTELNLKEIYIEVLFCLKIVSINEHRYVLRQTSLWILPPTYTAFCHKNIYVLVGQAYIS